MLLRKKHTSHATVLALTAAVGCGSARADTPSPWGVSPSSELSAEPSAWLSVMAKAGATTVRGYDYKKGPAGLIAYRDAGMAVTGILTWSPQRPRSFPVHDLEGFRRFVIDTVKTYRYIKTWEVWNEPPNGTKDTSPASYGAVVATAYDAAKSVDKQLQIGLAAKSVHIRFLADAIAGGARGKFDFISLHPYETAAFLPQGWELPFLGIHDNVRAMLRERDPSSEHVPLWFTEIGVQLDPKDPAPVREQMQAASLLKIYTLGLAQGVSHIHWFDPRDSEGKHHGLLRRDGSMRPAYRALHALTAALGATPKFTGYVALSPHAYAFLFAGPESDVLVAWKQQQADAEGSLSVAPDTSRVEPAIDASAQTPAGEVRLGATPTLLRAPRGSATSNAWRARATASLPAAWSCASKANVASFVAGQPPCGLHMVDPAPVSHAQGKPEIDLSGTVGARFAVDPAYVGYTHQALEITAVVRGHGQGKPGFNFKYEAQRPLTQVNDHGMVGVGGWNHIHGDKPTTLRWSVRDARFVGKYGVNLAIECDSKPLCELSLISLSVRKR